MSFSGASLAGPNVECKDQLRVLALSLSLRLCSSLSTQQQASNQAIIICNAVHSMCLASLHFTVKPRSTALLCACRHHTEGPSGELLLIVTLTYCLVGQCVIALHQVPVATAVLCKSIWCFTLTSKMAGLYCEISRDAPAFTWCMHACAVWRDLQQWSCIWRLKGSPLAGGMRS